MIDDDILNREVISCIKVLKKYNVTVATAESCTGGLLATLLTNEGGASEIFDRGAIVYSNLAKCDMLGVRQELLDSYGAVSAEVACAMSEGIINRSKADIGISITGIAGPSGGSIEKPVGLVYIGYAIRRQKADFFTQIFRGNRTEIRFQTAKYALDIIKNCAEKCKT